MGTENQDDLRKVQLLNWRRGASVLSRQQGQTPFGMIVFVPNLFIRHRCEIKINDSWWENNITFMAFGQEQQD